MVLTVNKAAACIKIVFFFLFIIFVCIQIYIIVCNATRNAGDHCRTLCRACQQYTFEHTLQGGEFAQDKIATHFTMLNVQNTLVLLLQSSWSWQTPTLMVLILETVGVI